MSIVNGAFGFASATSGRFVPSRARIQGSPAQGINYPSPFFDLAHTYLPASVKQLFRWCRYYFLTNPLVNAAVFKLSEYPITDLIIEHSDPQVRNRWTEYFHEHLRYKPFQIECGLDYHVYGNSMTSIGFPFKKFLRCASCGFQERAEKIRSAWLFTNFSFRLTCPACGNTSEAQVKDFYYKNASGINLIRWNSENVEILYNDLSGETTYFYTIPPTVRNDIVIGKKDVVESVPQVFIQAMRQQKGVVFSKDNFFHMKRATLAQQDRGWGIPLSLPLLKDLFYLQLMKKSQEAVLLEHVVPLRVLFPQPGSGSADPYCVSPDTLVETIDGLQPASEVQEGDYLRSHTGAWRRVIAQRRRAVGSREKVYKVTVASLAGVPFKVSEEHPILVVPSTSGHKRARQTWVDPEFIPVRKLKVGDYVAYPTKRPVTETVLDLKEYLPNRAYTDEWVYLKSSQGSAEVYEWFERRASPKLEPGERRAAQDQFGWTDKEWRAGYASFSSGVVRIPRYLSITKELAALIGYYLAEGSVGDGGMVSLAFHSNEVALHREVDACVRALGFEKGVYISYRKDCKGATVGINSVLLSELLVGLCGEGFADKRIPQVLSEAPDHIVLSMLRTLFSGDGCNLRTNTNRVGLKLANPSVVLETRRLLLSFGLVGGVMAEEPTETSISKSTSYALNYNGPVAEALRALLSGEPMVELRQRSGVFRDGYVLMPIRKIEQIPIREVIGFQMATDKSFCVSGVATHNTSINLSSWKEHVAEELVRWKLDQNYIPILPLPIGHQTIGGDGRALLLTQEMQLHSDQIIAGMGCPREFLYGGMQFSGSNVSMRMMENAFINYILRHKQQANWIMKMVGAYMGWPIAKIKFKPFKMADDLQRKAYRFQLNQAQKISDTTLLADEDLEQEDEDELMVQETSKRLESTKKQQLAMAEVQAEAQVIMAKAQVKAQQVANEAMNAPAAPGEPGGMEGAAPTLPPEMQSSTSQSQDMAQPNSQTGTSIIDLAQMLAQQMVQLPPDQQQVAYQNLEAQSPELAQLVHQFVSQMQQDQPQGMGGALGASASQVDTRPLPTQLPPRRQAQLV